MKKEKHFRQRPSLTSMQLAAALAASAASYTHSTMLTDRFVLGRLKKT